MILSLISIIAAIFLLGILLYRYVFFKKSDLTAQEPGIALQLLKLQPKISWCKFLEHVGDYGKKIAAQFQMIMQMQNTSTKILQQKFSTQEITYVRYQQVIEASHQLLLDNTLKLIPLLETLDNTAHGDLSNESQLVAKIDALFAFNEEMMEKLNALILNLSELKNLTGPDQQTTQFLLQNLDKLIERAKYY